MTRNIKVISSTSDVIQIPISKIPVVFNNSDVVVTVGGNKTVQVGTGRRFSDVMRSMRPVTEAELQLKVGASVPTPAHVQPAV